MYKYAKVDENNVVESIGFYPAPLQSENLMAIADWHLGEVGQIWTGSAFIDPPKKQYMVSLVITAIDSDAPESTLIEPDFTEITCLVNTPLHIKAELQAVDGSRIPLTDTFRMPVRSRNGQEDLWMVSVKEGKATLSITMDMSGVWQVTEQEINEALPEGRQMGFEGIQIFVCR